MKIFAQQFGTKMQHVEHDHPQFLVTWAPQGATLRCPRDQKQNRKLIYMTSLVERWEKIIFGDYTRHLNRIWYGAQ